MVFDARPVKAGGASSRVSNAAPAGGGPSSCSNHSRRPGPSASGSSVRSLPGFAAASAAAVRVLGRDMPCTCVGPPTTSRSTPASSSSSAPSTAATRTGPSTTSRMPAAIASATRCVLPYIDSYTTTVFIAASSSPPMVRPRARTSQRRRSRPQGVAEGREWRGAGSVDGRMPIQRLNHPVLYVRGIERTREFYEGALGFRVVNELAGKALFFQAPGSTNDHDLGTFAIGDGAGPSEAGRRTVGLYHLAWEVDTLAELARIREALLQAGALVGASDHATTKALYAQDPDGIEFEVSWLLPADLITPEVQAHGATTRPLDLEREIERYGAQTRGGVGVSVPALG